MRIDVLTIFPEYLPLELSLIRKARRDRLLDLRPRPAQLDARPAPHRGRHPLGGGAGMVVAVGEPSPPCASGAGGLGEDVEPLIIFPNPTGTPFSQSTAQE